MTIEYIGSCTSTWFPKPGSVQGQPLPVRWPTRSGIFYDTHRECVQPSEHYEMLKGELFRYQLPHGDRFETRGDLLSDRLAKDLNSSFHIVAVICDQYNRIRGQIKDKIVALAKDRASPPIELEEEEVFGFCAYAQAAVSGISAYLDLLGKYLFLLFFRRVDNVNENTGYRRRSYFREFRQIFYDPDTLEPRSDCPTFTSFLTLHHDWLERAFCIRDFFQHAGVPNPLIWWRDGEYHIDFSAGLHDIPLYRGAFLDSVSLGSLLMNLNKFNDDLKVFIKSYST